MIMMYFLYMVINVAFYMSLYVTPNWIISVDVPGFLCYSLTYYAFGGFHLKFTVIIYEDS